MLYIMFCCYSRSWEMSLYLIPKAMPFLKVDGGCVGQKRARREEEEGVLEPRRYY
uniref:Uncharacterized protein n=1 Tax=Helianthus annuus TaxID=4232 RepID=A0A251VPU8_HELAN